MDKLKEFQLYLILKGLASTTIKKNLSCIKNLLKTLPDLQKSTLDQYFITHLEQGKSAAYLNIVIVALRHWWGFTGEEIIELKYFRLKETNKATLSDREIEAFLALPYIAHRAVSKNNYHNWTLFFKILAYSGMRPGEVVGLTVESIDFGRGVFVLEKTKTTPRLVPIAPTLIDDLTKHMKETNNILFTRKGKPFTRQMWHHYFDTRIARLGIKRKNLTCYSLRHSFITRMLDEDVNLFKVQKIVGHKRIETTARYTHLTTKDIIKTIRKDPLARTSLSLYERKKMFRELAFKLLEDYADTAEEEKELIDSLKIYS